VPIGSKWATAVVATAVSLLLVVISDAMWHTDVAPARSRADAPPPARDREAVKAELLRACGDDKLDPADFKLGAMVDDGNGRRIVVASTARSLAMCGVHPFGSGAGVGPVTEATLRNSNRVVAKAGGVDADTGFLGYGRTLPQVTGLEIFLPNGRQVLSDVAAETFAYFVPLPRDKVVGLTVKVTDQSGAVLYDGPL
jgi:hypothetical protein